jgi:hypothetical protein
MLSWHDEPLMMSRLKLFAAGAVDKAQAIDALASATGIRRLRMVHPIRCPSGMVGLFPYAWNEAESGHAGTKRAPSGRP